MSEVQPYAVDGAVEDLGADGCRLSLGAWTWEALAASFGRFGGEMSAVEPAELVAAFGVLARGFEAAATGR
ncbi:MULTISPECIES: hypothetical protein [unclassified Rathayibacter]|uniref:hypothetical protein n=1 Tax=unclassified Rathayibacter TaxID=2609250 RepID=UPI000B1DD101